VLPVNFLGVLARFNKTVDFLIHLTQFVAVFDRRFDFSNVHSVLLVACREGNEDVLDFRVRINRSVLGLTEGH